MKNLSLILNAVLIIAVAYLFYEVNSLKGGKSASANVAVKTIAAPTGAMSIVYVNSDTLLDKYDYYQDLKKQLETKQSSAETTIQNRATQLEGEIRNYQERGASMSEAERAKEEERLGRKQEELVEYRKNLLSKLSDEEEAFQDSLHNRLVGYLKEYNKDKNYKIILGYQKGSGILLADDSLDITKEIIEGINKKK